MAEEKQLTVAELLARNRQENQTEESAKPTRRRRRSLEDGGVSVAELTGSFKAVTAQPAQSKHSSVPLDEATPPVEQPAPEPAPEPTPRPAPASDDTSVIQKVVDTPAPAAPAAPA